MIDREVSYNDVLQALTEIDKNGVPRTRESTKYNLYHSGKAYPPKYVLSIATKFAVGRGLEPSEFHGGKETNNFLKTLGFVIREGNIPLS